jgi:signal transduction histidine kinase
MRTKILIVDDLKENIYALSELIKGDDVELLTAQNADQALSLLLDHEFALALLDVQMPGMTGFELARLVRGVERSRHLPIIFVTAQQVEASTIFEGYDTGAVDVLFKPLDPHIVRSKVRVFVRLDQQARLLQSQVEAMSRLKQEAESANVAKSRFLANMSHEIRTPLSAVLGFSDILSQNGLSNDERTECLNSISRNGKLLLRIIDDILDLSRIEAQKIEFETKRFDLGELVRDLKATLSHRAAEKGINFEVTDQSIVTGLIESDALRLKQILLNVIGNAIKFTARGRVSVEITLERGAEFAGTQTLSFRVRDSGIGLTADEARRIFEPFAQADNATHRKYGGTGLGLAISRQLAQSLGGDVIVSESVPGFGSVFDITLRTPYFVGNAPAAASEQPKAELTSDLTKLHGKRVLVVDDVQDNRTLIERYLKPTGLELYLASSGQEAIDQVSTSNWDLILMDIQMPSMDGYEATAKLRSGGFKNPIIALTAHAMREELDRCLSAGFDSTLTKPVARKELIERIAQMLN